MSSTTPQPAPAPARSPQGTARNYLAMAFALSLVIHVIGGGAFANYKPPKPQKEVVTKIDVSKKTKIVVPTPPPPTPTPPPPTPPPKSTPPPVKSTAPPPVKAIKLNVVKSINKSSHAAQAAYVPPPKGDENGAPQGNAATGAPAPTTTSPPAPTSAPATAVPTPVKPACSVPNQDAETLNKVDPDYPDAARAASASGTVKVKVDLSAAGVVEGATVYASSGNMSLDNAAVSAAKQSTYQPEIVDCVKEAKSYLFVAVFDPQ